MRYPRVTHFENRKKKLPDPLTFFLRTFEFQILMKFQLTRKMGNYIVVNLIYFFVNINECFVINFNHNSHLY